ncbi:hypothetical protein EG329_014367 [Mollisiaceae sp. DMI_Dod_QoI]|nr:hypothetical protein EG329_014367 [Helotiales sp. DMI_Dod_QoI]
MIELYNGGTSIPDIHKAIQCEGFQPWTSQRSVYLKFQSMGLPTDLVGRSRLRDAKFPSNSHPDTETTFSTPAGSQSPNFSTNGHMDSNLYPLPGDDMLVDSTDPWPHSYEVGSPPLGPDLGDVLARKNNLEPGGIGCNPSADFDALKSPSLWSPSNGTTNSQNWNLPASTFDQACEFPTPSMELNGAAYFNINTGSHEFQSPSLDSNNEHNISGASFSNLGWNEVDNAEYGSSLMNFPTMDLDHVPNSSTHETAWRSQRKTGLNEGKIPFPNIINTASSNGARTKLRSLFRPRSSGSSQGKKRYPTSQYTHNTEDSGYASGYASCLTLEDIQQADPQSLSEFNDIPTCRLIGVYEFDARDAAGNTALHYAAAGGGNFLHLKALIDAGVDAYAANTAGELFIHCLRPLQPFTLELNSDCLKGDDLIRLLQLLEPERVFGWRDNNGQTILHALALKIADPELKAKIFTISTNAGYHASAPDRFGRTPHDVVPLSYDCHGQVIDPAPINSFRENKETTGISGEMVIGQSGIFPEWRQPQIKQIKSQEVVLEARRNQAYVDPATGDNVLHALSRLKSSNDILLRLEHFDPRDTNVSLHQREGNQILLHLENFVPKGVDLNLHNREGNHPLKSFICDRPSEENETGATISKYLDALLWRDCTERVRTIVNVNMKDREGGIALHSAAIRGRPDSVRSLIAAGANVNARSDNGLSVLQAAFNALDEATASHTNNNSVFVHLIKEVISHLEHAGAVQNPSSLQERGIRRP